MAHKRPGPNHFLRSRVYLSAVGRGLYFDGFRTNDEDNDKIRNKNNGNADITGMDDHDEDNNTECVVTIATELNNIIMRNLGLSPYLIRTVLTYSTKR